MHLTEQNPEGHDSKAGSREPVGAPEYDAEDIRLALRLAAILKELDPDAFVFGDAATEAIAVDGHWRLPAIVRWFREELGAHR